MTIEREKKAQKNNKVFNVEMHRTILSVCNEYFMSADVSDEIKNL